MSDLSSFFAGLLALVPGLATEAPPSWNGYVEADYVYVAPASGGTITTLAVKQGQWVEAGAVLLDMEDGQQRAALRAEGVLVPQSPGVPNHTRLVAACLDDDVVDNVKAHHMAAMARSGPALRAQSRRRSCP